MDFTNYDYEIYLCEKTFFNDPHMFVTFVIEHKNKPVFQYIRPNGLYWEQLNKNYKGDIDLNSILKEEKYESHV